MALLSPDTRIDTIPNRFVVSFKRPRSGRLLNIAVLATGEVEAGRHAKVILAARGEPFEGSRGWHEYGVSRATRVLTRHVVWGSKGVFEEWREGGWQSTLVESRELTSEEVRLEYQRSLDRKSP